MALSLDNTTFIIPPPSLSSYQRTTTHQNALDFFSIAESTQIVLLQSVVMLFASPDGYAGSSMQAAIASSSGTFSSVWQSADGYAYGVTFNEIVDLGGIGSEGDPTRGTQDYLNRDNVEVSIDSLVHYLFIFGFLF